MITEPKLKSYRNSEFLEFISSTIELVNRSGIVALDPPKAALEVAYNNLDNSFKVSQGSLLTATVQELDVRRDDAVRGLRGLAKAYTYHFDTDKKAAGIAIFQAINKYSGNIAQLNYQAQTATLKSLSGDFEDDAVLAAAIVTLDLAAWTAELKNANIDFETKYLDRVTDQANKKVAPVSEQRPAAIEAYNTLIQHIQANHILNPSAALTELIGQLNELVMKYNAL